MYETCYMSHLTPEVKQLYQEQLARNKKAYADQRDKYTQEKEGTTLGKVSKVFEKLGTVAATTLLGPTAGGAVNLAYKGLNKILGPGEVDQEATQEDEYDTMTRLKNDISRTEEQLRDKSPAELEAIAAKNRSQLSSSLKNSGSAISHKIRDQYSIVQPSNQPWQ